MWVPSGKIYRFNGFYDDDDDNDNNNHTGHCTNTAESANVKVQNVFHGQNNITCSTKCKHRTAATVCAVETWFVCLFVCYRYVTVNTVHKGDNKNSNSNNKIPRYSFIL